MDPILPLVDTKCNHYVLPPGYWKPKLAFVRSAIQKLIYYASSMTNYINYNHVGVGVIGVVSYASVL